jgi:alpha-L-rhamnosidase
MARHRTPYGIAECAWAIKAGQFQISVVVPPNTTARISLPGSDAAPLDVGSGTHRWSYTYQDPDACPPLTIDNLVGEVVDDAEAWAAVMNTVARLAPMVPFLVRGIQSQSGLPLRRVLGRAPNADELCAAIESELAMLGR